MFHSITINFQYFMWYLSQNISIQFVLRYVLFNNLTPFSFNMLKFNINRRAGHTIHRTTVWEISLGHEGHLITWTFSSCLMEQTTFHYYIDVASYLTRFESSKIDWSLVFWEIWPFSSEVISNTWIHNIVKNAEVIYITLGGYIVTTLP